MQGLTHVGEADGWWKWHAGPFGQLVFFKSIRKTTQIVFALSVQSKPQIDLDLGLDCPACRSETFLTRNLQKTWNKTNFRMESDGTLKTFQSILLSSAPSERWSWLSHSPSLFPALCWRKGYLWRGHVRRRSACHYWSSRWKHQGHCAEAVLETDTLISGYRHEDKRWLPMAYAPFKIPPHQPGTAALPGSCERA